MQMPTEGINSGGLLDELRTTLAEYFAVHPNMSLNGLAKKCSVSEPTLRRILKGQIKTLPTNTTILEVLSAISGEKNAAKLAERYSGSIGDYLRLIQPQIEDCQPDFDNAVHAEFKDPVKYVIYKLSANSSGVTEQKIQDLFGMHGLSCAEELLRKGFIQKDGVTFSAHIRNFTSSSTSFIDNFKVLAEFLKGKFSVTKPNLNPLVANYSESITPKAYEEIIHLQKKTLTKIRQIMSAPESQGEIPLFMLLAIDTLDNRAAHEISDPAD